MIQGQALSEFSEIRSEVVFFPSRAGKRIVGFLDVAAECPEDAPYVVVSPKFGESKKNNLQLAYQLAANGLKVLRFDHTNHVGESEGEIQAYTFSGAVDDIHSAIDYLEVQHGVKQVQLVANSLSARCALRVAAVDPRVYRLVMLVGVVNFQRTATEVYQRDMVAEYSEGRMQGISDILGHQVDVDAFLEDSIQHDLHNLSGSVEDISNLKCKTFFISAERDVWVDIKDVETLASGSDLVSISLIENAMHELRENPGAAAIAMRSLVYVCATGELPREGGAEVQLREPSKKDLFAQNKIERDRLKAAAPLRESEKDFWKDYLQRYNILESVGDYQEYLSLVGDCLGQPQADQVYFDCGCGNGMFGAWCIRDVLLQEKDWGLTPPVYFGLDLTNKGLTDASLKHFNCEEGVGDARAALDLMYLRYDLDEIDLETTEGTLLPFADNSIDRICCSLLISYLKRPDFLLRELFRILKSDGKIIVSSMKPYCDLSIIYKDVVDESSQDETLQSARDLLSAAGAIKLKEEEGHYKFYEKEELTECVAAAGFSRVKVYRSFGDQANLVCAEK
jgi:SAM-dependent methyltransferase/pimeloyl-ACP methyl ester carboxylesterase